MTITLTREAGKYIARFPFDMATKDLVKAAGFRFDGTRKVWWTDRPEVAAKVTGDPAALAAKVNAERLAQHAKDEAAILASRATGAEIDVPAPKGCVYAPYQLAAIAYAQTRPTVLVGDEPGCIDGDAVVHVNRAGKGYATTLAKLYRSWRRLDHSVPTRMRALCNGELRQHEVRDVLYKGRKPVVRLTLASGKTLRLTEDHEVLSGNWIPAGNLKPGDQVSTNGVAQCQRCGSTAGVATYAYAKFRGFCHPCIYRYLRTNKWGTEPATGRHLDKDGYVLISGQWDHPRQQGGTVPEHILIMEKAVGRFVADGEVVHHRDENTSNNELGNLELLSHSEHHRRHGKHRNMDGGTAGTGGRVSFIPKMDTVASVTPDGAADVYDVVMAAPHRNFVANGVIVHNCGKTIEALGIVNADPSIRAVLVICPATLKLNWKREAEKWLVRPMSVAIATDVLPAADVVILNYEQVRKHRAAIDGRVFDLMVADESHYLKNPKAQRTGLVLGKWSKDPADRIEPIKARRRVFMTGTPFLNRPVELWPTLKAIDPQGLGKNWKAYVTRYCAGYEGEHGWDVSGASNLEELQARLRSAVMIRRQKKDIMTELPPKRRQVVVIEAESAEARAAIKREAGVVAANAERIAKAKAAVAAAKASSDPKEYEKAVAALRVAEAVAFEEIARERHRVAVAKIPQLIAHLEDSLENGKVVAMIWHHDVADALEAHFGSQAVVVTGETKMADRQGAVDAFQTDPAKTLFIGSIKAAGVGITLTAASLIVFGELWLVPGDMTQAEDRIHRKGQTDSVLIQHLVLDGSYDQRAAEILVEKQRTLDAALDNEAALPAPVMMEAPRPAPEEATSPAGWRAPEGLGKPQDGPPAPDVPTLPPEVAQAVHDGLRRLAGLCDGALALDDQGFNRMDADFGKSLAMRASLSPKQALAGRKLCLKYHRQLPADLLAIVKGTEL